MIGFSKLHIGAGGREYGEFDTTAYNRVVEFLIGVEAAGGAAMLENVV